MFEFLFLIICNVRKTPLSTLSRSESSLEDPLNPGSAPQGEQPPIWVETVNRIKTDAAMIREKGVNPDECCSCFGCFGCIIYLIY